MTGNSVHAEPEQLELLDTPPAGKAPKPPTPKQQFALDQLAEAGQDGLTTDKLGARLHEWGGPDLRSYHPAAERCLYCSRDGRKMLLALKAKGLVRYRAGRLKVWQLADLPADAAENTGPAADHEGAGPVPYNAFPAGF